MPPSEKSTPSIGILALQSGAITQKQLMECIELQRGEGGDIETILANALAETGLPAPMAPPVLT